LIYVEKLTASGSKAKAILDKGLPHGHLGERHMSEKAKQSFENLCQSLLELAEQG